MPPKEADAPRTTLPLEAELDLAELASTLMEDLTGEPQPVQADETPQPQQLATEDDDTEAVDGEDGAVEATDDDDSPVLSDDDTEDDTEDAEGAAGDAKWKAENFKLREERRALRAELTAKDKQIEDLKAATLQSGSRPSLPPAFDGVASETDLDAREEAWQANLDYLEDRPEGYTYTNANGEEVEVSAQQVREWRAALKATLRQAPKVRQQLAAHAATLKATEEKARKRYPFVFDSTKAQHDLVLNLATEHPELAQSPKRALALGRMAIGALVESGEYVLTKRVKTGSKPAHAAPPAPPSPSTRRPAQTQPARGSVTEAQALEEAVMAALGG